MNPPRTNDFIKIVSNKVMSKFCPQRGDFHPNSGDVSNRGQKMKSCMELPLMKGMTLVNDTLEARRAPWCQATIRGRKADALDNREWMSGTCIPNAFLSLARSFQYM